MKKIVLFTLLLLSTTASAEVILNKRVDFENSPSADVTVDAKPQEIKMDVSEVGSDKGFVSHVKHSESGKIQSQAYDKKTGKTISQFHGEKGKYAKGFSDTETFSQNVDMQIQDGEMVGTMQFKDKVNNEEYLVGLDGENKTLSITKNGYRIEIFMQSDNTSTTKIIDTKTNQIICYVKDTPTQSYAYDSNKTLIAKGGADADLDEWTIYNQTKFEQCKKIADSISDEDEDEDEYEDEDNTITIENVSQLLDLLI